MPHRRPPPPLDAQSLERLAVRYVERFATSRGKLTGYLRRKVRERGWDGPEVDVASIAERMASLGYVDDRLFAESKLRSLARRGYGARRVEFALQSAGIEAEDQQHLAPAIEENALGAALIFARRKKLGPFGTEAVDRVTRQKQIAAMIRAGHGYELARRIVDTAPGEPVEADD